MTMQGRVAIYMRFGTREQIGADLSWLKRGLVCEGQRVALYVQVPQEAKTVDSGLLYSAVLEYCSEQAYSLSEKHIYVEERAGEELSARPALTSLREDASRREFDVVLTYPYERLAREEAPLTDLIGELAQYDVRIETVEGHF